MRGALRRLLDWFMFAWAEMWVIMRHPVLWAELQMREWREGVILPRVAVPRTANEKFLWRRLFDRDPRFPILCDKIASKEWLETLDLGVPTPPTLWVATNAGDIPDHVLDGDVYIKAAHGWNMNIRLSNGVPPRDEWTPRANDFMARSHGKKAHEWGYFPVPRRLMVEPTVASEADLIDLRIYLSGGIPERILLDFGDDGVSGSIWQTQGDPLDAGSWVKTQWRRRPHIPVSPHPLPTVTGRALRAAVRIGNQLDSVRVDFLTDGHQLWLGELTIYSRAGYTEHLGTEPILEDVLTRRWDLRRSWFLTMPQTGWRGRYAQALRRAIDRQAHANPLLDSAGPLPDSAVRQMHALTQDGQN